MNLENISKQELIRIAKIAKELELRRKLDPLKYFVPQDYQQAFFKSKKKNKAIFGGNRSGKTLCSAAYMIKKCINNRNFTARASTWADMSVPIQQKTVYDLLPKKEIEYADYSEKRGFVNKIIIFNNGSKIRFKTYEQGRQSYQGAGLDLEWDDEEPPEEIVAEQKARLIDRGGELIRSMTPLNGITYTYDEIIVNEKNNPEVEYWFWDSTKNIYLDKTSLENILDNYAQKEAEVRRTGHFQNLKTGLCYYAFSDENIVDKFEYMPNRPLEISCDFNISLMSWHIGQELNGIDYTFDFVELRDFANTELLCQMLKEKYREHKGGFIFYGDISGNQRHPEASLTNWAIIQNNFPDAKIYYQNIKNIKDRVDAVNSRLKNNRGEIKYLITKNCKQLIRDYRRVTWEMLMNKNKAGDLTHASDGESYKLYWKHPIITQPKISVTL